MNPLEFGPRAFRTQLEHELGEWLDEGIIDEETAAILAERYRLDEEDSSLATAAIYLLGALLVGGGVVSLAAWNWGDIPRAFKFVLLAAPMLSAHILGYRMWKVTGTRPVLGHGLVFLGTLLFGANIAVVGEMYHVDTDWYGGFGALAAGAAMAGWLMRSVPNALVALLAASLWSLGLAGETESWEWVPPIVVGAVSLPLAYRARSSVLFTFGTIGLVVAMGAAAGIETEEFGGWLVATMAGSVAVLALSLGHEEGSIGRRFAPFAQAVGMFGCVLGGYLCSFTVLCEEADVLDALEHSLGWLAYTVPALLFAFLWTARAWRRDPRAVVKAPATLAALGMSILVIAVLPLQDKFMPASIPANAGLVVISFAAISSAVRGLSRVPFWLGALLAGLVIVSRFFEFDVDLWVKAIVFIACGVAVIVFGVAFERSRKNRKAVLDHPDGDEAEREAAVDED